jgi:hydrogenase nickel incorporation protein HypA/HybF
LHEISIAASIVEVAARHAGGRRVERVFVRVGHLRQVVPSALTFGFALVAQGTTVEGAELCLEEVPARGMCRECGTESVLESFPLSCGACGGFDLEILAGEEMYVESLEMEDEPAREGLIAEG